eukprot:COSAG04_NODE_10337_length_785_cov_1.615160_2_plen_116_part_00
MSYIQEPPAYSLLHCREVPGDGDGATEYADMVGALSAMPPALRSRIEGRSVKHCASHSSDGTLRRGFVEPTSAESAPGAVHPMIRDLGDGREALFLGRRPCATLGLCGIPCSGCP